MTANKRRGVDGTKVIKRESKNSYRGWYKQVLFLKSRYGRGLKIEPWAHSHKKRTLLSHHQYEFRAALLTTWCPWRSWPHMALTICSLLTFLSLFTECSQLKSGRRTLRTGLQRLKKDTDPLIHLQLGLFIPTPSEEPRETVNEFSDEISNIYPDKEGDYGRMKMNIR